MNTMMRKNNNRGGNNKHRGGGGRRYQNHGGNRNGGGNDGQNLSRQKHHATQMREKFANMARDAQNNGDRVDIEYYLQHVDHYTRVLNDIAAIEAERFAHQREQHQATATESGEQFAGEGNGEMPSEPHTPSSHQPRMTRPPRHSAAPVAETQAGPDDAASDGGSEIPLPGLPTI